MLMAYSNPYMVAWSSAVPARVSSSIVCVHVARVLQCCAVVGGILQCVKHHATRVNSQSIVESPTSPSTTAARTSSLATRCTSAAGEPN